MSNDTAPTRRRLLNRAGVGAGVIAGLTGCLGIDRNDASADGETPSEGDGNDSDDREEDTSDGDEEDDGDEDDESDPYEVERERYAIMEGTEYETTVHVLTASGSGPTAFALGGMHGDERAGIEAAHVATEYGLDRGRLVLVPEANKPAVEANERHGPEGDFNRKFPIGEEPTTDAARAIWDEIREHDPDLLIDMHSSRGVYGVHGDETSGVGQAIFPNGVDDSREQAEDAADYLNREVLAPRLEDDIPEYDFVVPHPEDEMEEEHPSAHLMLVNKAGADLGLKGWITEVTYRGLDLDEQVYLHDRLTRHLLAQNGIETTGPLDDVENPLLSDDTESIRPVGPLARSA